MRMRNERRFSAWHVFVTCFALFICWEFVSGFLASAREYPDRLSNKDFTWTLAVICSLFVFFLGAALYLLKELWVEFRLLWNRSRQGRH